MTFGPDAGEDLGEVLRARVRDEPGAGFGLVACGTGALAICFARCSLSAAGKTARRSSLSS